MLVRGYLATHIYGNVESSQIGTAGSSQRINHGIDVSQLKAVIAALNGALEQFGVDERVKRELMAEVQTLEAQAASPKPKNTIIKESLATVRNVLEGVVGNLAAASILNQISNLKI